MAGRSIPGNSDPLGDLTATAKGHRSVYNIAMTIPSASELETTGWALNLSRDARCW